MRNVLMLALAAVAGATLFAATRPQEAPVPMARFYLGLIRKGPEWSADVTDARRELQAAHLANIGRLADEGKLVLAGPIEGDHDLRGLFFYDCETEAEARALADSDPAVKAGRLVVDLLPWWGTSLVRELHPMAKRIEAEHAGKDGAGGGSSDELEDAVVEAACGQCQFELDAEGCDLAVRIDGQAWFVSGTGIDEHGDAHAKDGFCNAVRQARVTGVVKGDRFVATAFELVHDEG